MKEPSYILTAAAEADLRDIIRYTRKHWGDPQVRCYVAALENGMARLSERQGAYQDMSAIYSGLCMAHCEHHYVFCLSRQSAPALIVAIFHERMDLMTRLSGRLK